MNVANPVASVRLALLLKRAVFVCVVAASALLSACQEAPITGRRQLVLISDQQATEMGVQAYQEIKSKQKISQNAELNARVQRVGRRIADAVGKGPAWEFTLFEDPTANAFALPGGKVGVNTGLFQVAKNDAQLAAVLGHEIAHVTAAHSAERISQQALLNVGLQGLGAAGGGQQLAQLAAAAATLGVVLPFSRGQESEADEIGLHYMARAGYDPREAVTLWQNFEKAGGERPPQFLSTHPSPGNRVERLRALLPKVMPIWQQNAVR